MTEDVTGRTFIDVGDRSATDVNSHIRRKVLDSEGDKEGIRSGVRRRAAILQRR